MGCIVRTAGIGRSDRGAASWDIDYLLRVWEAIKQVVVTRPAPFLIYQEGNAIVRALRDYFSNDIGEILIDDPAIHQDARGVHGARAAAQPQASSSSTTTPYRCSPATRSRARSSRRYNHKVRCRPAAAS